MTRVLRALSFAVLACAGATEARGDEFTFFHENVMGTSLELRVRAADEPAARRAEGRALAEVDRLSAVFSGYDPASEFSRWKAAAKGPKQVSAELAEVLKASDEWRLRTGGAFDPRVETLTRLWSESERRGRTPSAGERLDARRSMARPAWKLGISDGVAERVSDVPISLNAIAKGYIVERACEAAFGRTGVVTGVVLNVGGDLRVAGDASAVLGVASPRGDSESTRPVARIEVRDRAVATSGDYQRGFRIGGRFSSHIFDPRTGEPAGGVASATVVAPRSADADALATALNVLAPEEGVRLAESLPGVECLVLAADGRAFKSAGWSRLELVEADDSKPADGPKDAWGDVFELSVDFEINRPEAEPGRYRRPYVAIWVEDKGGFPVRTLTHWLSRGGAGPFQWVPDLKRWYAADKLRRTVDRKDFVTTISRATRPPGKYAVVWDGKDDRGKPVGPGEYVLHIESAREHGSYSSMRLPVTLARTPFKESLKGNEEMKGAAVEYRQKSPAR